MFRRNKVGECAVRILARQRQHFMIICREQRRRFSRRSSREAADRVREQYALSANAKLCDALVAEALRRLVSQLLPPSSDYANSLWGLPGTAQGHPLTH